MAGDGVSLPTTLAQMGSVAKTQAKAQQQPAQQTAPFAEQLDKQEELRIQRVREMKEAEKKKIDRENEKQDRRRKRREKRRDKQLANEDREPADGDSDKNAEESDTIGTLLDLRV